MEPEPMPCPFTTSLHSTSGITILTLRLSSACTVTKKSEDLQTTAMAKTTDARTIWMARGGLMKVAEGLILVLIASIPLTVVCSPPLDNKSAVHVLFGIDHPENGIFPSDIFTLADDSQKTGLRVNLPLPDCAV